MKSKNGAWPVVAVLLGVGTGIALGACYPIATCPSATRPPLQSTTLATTGINNWGEAPVDGAFQIDVDMNAANVTMNFDSEGREVVLTYRIVSTEDVGHE